MGLNKTYKNLWYEPKQKKKETGEEQKSVTTVICCNQLLISRLFLFKKFTNKSNKKKM